MILTELALEMMEGWGDVSAVLSFALCDKRLLTLVDNPVTDLILAAVLSPALLATHPGL